MASPTKLAHIVLQTYDVKGLCEWYCTVLNAHVVFEELPKLSFITYDEEHHRMGFAQLPGTRVEPSPVVPGLRHSAWTYRNIRELLGEYERLKAAGIVPNVRINHGPTFSLYYTDPDGNNAELMIDRLSLPEADQFMRGAVFKKNPVGIEIDPDELVKKMHAGASDDELLVYDADKPVDVPGMIKRFAAAREAQMQAYRNQRKNTMG